MKWLPVLLLVLCGCASEVAVPPPQVSTADFAVTPLPNHVFLIAYKGAPQVTNQRVVDLSLLKASELVRQYDLKHFAIVDQAASKPGEMKFRSSLPDPADLRNELMIQGFKGRPHRVFSFEAEATEKSVYEKLRATEEAALY